MKHLQGRTGQSHHGDPGSPGAAAHLWRNRMAMRPFRAEAEAEPETTPATAQQANAAALLPAELLQPGELIILLIKPSAWFILLGSLRFLAIVGIITLGLLWLSTPEGWRYLGRSDILLLGTGSCMARLFWQFLVWLSHVYVLTDRRVIRVSGVLRVSVFETALKNVQHTSTYFSIRERIFALGSIGFATAGTGIIEAWWLMIASPLDTHQTIMRTLDRYR